MNGVEEAEAKIGRVNAAGARLLKSRVRMECECIVSDCLRVETGLEGLAIVLPLDRVFHCSLLLISCITLFSQLVRLYLARWGHEAWCLS